VAIWLGKNTAKYRKKFVFILYFLVKKSISGWQIINISASRYADILIIALLAGDYQYIRLPVRLPVHFLDNLSPGTLFQKK